jgi:dipeptidyl aminopeptidase/acylaminoacyl peptidase
LLASGPGGPDLSLGIWTISILGGAARRIRDNAWLATPSPDGSLIAFISPDYREIWVMKASGEEAHKIASMESSATFSQVAWAPDGQRLAYLKSYSLESRNVIESCDLRGQDVRLIWSDSRLKNFCWTRRGQIIGALTDAGIGGGPAHSDLWEVHVGSRGAPGQPSRLTDFAGFTALSLSATADGNHLALIRNYDQSDVYVGELDAGAAHLAAPRRLTLDDRIDWPGGWTRDSNAVLFYSDRQGSLDLFRQKLDGRAAELMLSSPEEKRQPQLTPDGSSIVYLEWPKGVNGATPSSGRVMRVPLTGGPPQLILQVSGYPGSAQTPRGDNMRVLTTNGHPDLRCSRTAGGSCVVTEGDSNRVTFYRFDPIRAGKNEISSVDAHGSSFWDLSGDGSKIAFGDVGRGDHVRILPVNGGAPRDVPVNGVRVIASIGWAADGESLFLTGTAPEGGSILRHVLMDGQSQLLYKSDAWLERPLASPDGAHLAFGLASSSNNVWTVENLKE